MYIDLMPLYLIVGPMFSGKTSRLIQIYREHCNRFPDDTPLLINHKMDAERYSADDMLTHDNDSERCYGVSDLNTVQYNPKKTRAIFINEAQLFNGLKKWVLNVLNNAETTDIYLCGLDSDFKIERFGELLDLVPYAIKVIKLQGKCYTEGCQNPSMFTHRITRDTQQIIIGTDNYIPVCRKCYIDFNQS